jgi:hypothetical protein
LSNAMIGTLLVWNLKSNSKTDYQNAAKSDNAYSLCLITKKKSGASMQNYF